MERWEILRKLDKLAGELRESSPGARVFVEDGAVWVQPEGARRAYGVYSATFEGQIVQVLEDGKTSLHRYAHVTWDEAVRRWPRLVRVMQWCACLSAGEAGCGLRDYIDGRESPDKRHLLRSGGGEAVDHYGGPAKLVKNAARFDSRSAVRSIHGEIRKAVA